MATVSPELSIRSLQELLDTRRAMIAKLARRREAILVQISHVEEKIEESQKLKSLYERRYSEQRQSLRAVQ